MLEGMGGGISGTEYREKGHGEASHSPQLTGAGNDPGLFGGAVRQRSARLVVDVEDGIGTQLTDWLDLLGVFHHGGDTTGKLPGAQLL